MPSLGSDNLAVSVFGEIAILTGQQKAQLELPNGARATQSIALTNLYRQIAGEWRLALTHAVELPAP